MKISRLPRLASLFLVPLAIVLALGTIAPTSVQAQEDSTFECLPGGECRALRETLREFRQELRPLRRELRELRLRIRELDPDDPERARLIARARATKQEIRQIRRERRPVARQFRHGCRRECFPS